MKFICNKNTLLTELLIAHDTISAKSTISILSNVLLKAEKDTLFINAKDMKVSFKSKIPVKIEIPGRTAIFCARLLNILKSLPDGDIYFDLNENYNLSIIPSSNRIHFNLKCIPPEKYPEQQDIEEEHFFEFPQRDFVDMISKSLFAISDDETRFFLNGVYLEKNDDKIFMVATDGRRLSLIKKDISSNIKNINGIIIPPKILQIVKKNSIGEGNLNIAITDKSIFIKLKNNLFSSSLIKGKFPDYQQIIPESNEYRLIISKKALQESLKRVSILVENKSRRIYLNIKANNLIVSSEESEIGKAQEEIDCNYDGPDSNLILNFLYLLEPIREIDEDNIVIEFTDTKKAIILKPLDNNDYFNIVMPLQIE